MDKDPVVVFTAQGELDETQVRSFLAAHDIRTTSRGEALRHTHAFIPDGLGAVEIMVAAEDEATARHLLDQAERGELTLTEDDTNL